MSQFYVIIIIVRIELICLSKYMISLFGWWFCSLWTIGCCGGNTTILNFQLKSPKHYATSFTLMYIGAHLPQIYFTELSILVQVHTQLSCNLGLLPLFLYKQVHVCTLHMEVNVSQVLACSRKCFILTLYF